MNDSRYRFADVIINISHEQLDRPFEYIIPDELADRIVPGSSVTVPFGISNREISGYVIEVKDVTEYPEDKLKCIKALNDSCAGIEGSLIGLAAWMKAHYGGTMIQSLKTVIPIKHVMKTKTVKRVDLTVKSEELLPVIEECENKHQSARLRLLKALMEEPTLPYSLLKSKLNITAATVKSFEDRGILKVTETEYYRNPVTPEKSHDAQVELSDEQKNIISSVMNDFEAGKPGKYLIHGITGSGKTEVYLGIAKEMVDRGKQVIVMIPEISLTYQTLLRFYKRFGDRVSVVNSSLTAGERFDQFTRAMNGEIDVIIGPRSALFTPFGNLGAVIIDEEHENSYKSENTPKFHARECAEYLCGTRGAALVLGSATPSLEAYYKAMNGEYTLFTLDRRLTGGRLPNVYTVDMREEMRLGNRSIFSDKLSELMKDRLGKGEQTMLFINRRGVAGFVSCRECGQVIKCIHCDVSMTEHANGSLVCHYCGYTIPKPKLCPSCGSKYIAGFKVGTEQVETQVKKMLPDARVVRMDADTTKEKGSMEKLIRSFSDHEADILVGTQMIVKGHDFPLVTLVGILAADLSLNISDFHAAERTFELLTQAAGRAGRGSRPGEAVFQTYQPDHYSIVSASDQDYRSFYEQEIAYRRLGTYPPVWHLLEVLFVAQDKESGKARAAALKQLADSMLTGDMGYSIGPAPAAISRLRDRYRFVLYIKHPDYEKLVSIKDAMEKYNLNSYDRRVLTFYDFDPVC